MLVAGALLLAGCRSRATASDGVTPSRADQERAQLDREVFEAMLPRDPPIAFRAVPGEAAVEHPCARPNEEACVLLVEKRYRGPSHDVWFLDTAGRSYLLRSRDKREDVFTRATANVDITPAELAAIVAASQPSPARASPSDVNHALALLAKSLTGATETVGERGCDDGGAARIDGYLFDSRYGFSTPIFLQLSECDVLVKENASPAARELSQWVHHLRGESLPRRPRPSARP
jgi:hypothetical protein